MRSLTALQQEHNDTDEHSPYTFFPDVSSQPQILHLVTAMTRSMNQSFSGVKQYLASWRKYQVLWTSEKTLVIEKMASHRLNYVAFDAQLALYRKHAMDVASRPKEKVTVLNVGKHAHEISEH